MILADTKKEYLVLGGVPATVAVRTIIASREAEEKLALASRAIPKCFSPLSRTTDFAAVQAPSAFCFAWEMVQQRSLL